MTSYAKKYSVRIFCANYKYQVRYINQIFEQLELNFVDGNVTVYFDNKAFSKWYLVNRKHKKIFREQIEKMHTDMVADETYDTSVCSGFFVVKWGNKPIQKKIKVYLERNQKTGGACYHCVITNKDSDKVDFETYVPVNTLLKERIVSLDYECTNSTDRFLLAIINDEVQIIYNELKSDYQIWNEGED